MGKETDKLLNGNYDGIQEYDNDLPRWWVWLFYLTIIFAVVYSYYYHFTSAQSAPERLAAQMADLEKVRQAAAPPQAVGGMSEEDLFKLTSDAAMLTKGKEVYAAKCAVCHGPDGQGLIGPNLTDKYWIHGAKLADMKRVVEQGVLDKGMLAWKGVIGDDEINAVLAFSFSIRNSNPANPKAPQGELVE